MGPTRLLIAGIIFALTIARAQTLPGTAPLTMEGDLSAQMIAGIDRFLERETLAAAAGRSGYWKVDTSGDRAAYEQSVQPNRDRLARILGVIDPRVPSVELEYIATATVPARVAETSLFTVYAVRWPVLDGLHAEGLLLQPKGRIIARVVALPDADQTPEVIAGLAPGLPAELQYARRLAENGCEVIVPTLVDRSDTFSGNPALNLSTNHPHREWIYRQSFVLGRNVGGYELQKIFAAVDWFTRRNREMPASIGVAGWGEGGLLALHSAALDRRIDATLVSGYFGPREQLWREPIYRNAFGLLNEFGDAEIARLIVPRALFIEHAFTPKVDGPPAARPRHSGAAPGRITPLDFARIREEYERARQLAGPHANSIRLHHGRDGGAIGPVAETTLLPFLQSLLAEFKGLRRAGDPPVELRPGFETIAGGMPALPAAVTARQERQVRGMERYTQWQLQFADRQRDEFLWKRVTPTNADTWHAAMDSYRDKAWHEMIGRYPTGTVPLNPRTRLLREAPTWTGYEVILDVLPEVYAWGYLLLPKGMKPGEKRSVVVTQHGVSGRPDSVISEDKTARAYATYQAYAVRLVERGFIVFAPHNPYTGDDAARVLQRKAQPIGKTIFSIIIAQHECILDFLSSRADVDSARIAFYGLSYGGQTAMRVPVIVERYAASICSGDFNEWTWKNASTDFSKSYMYNNAYERPEFRMGLTFGYAELAALMVPRPFMVERGHDDGVGIDEWVAYEYAKVRRLYDKLGISNRTEIEFFNGPHMIHGEGTFKFLHRHLNWPEPKETAASVPAAR
ncbi:MAG: dienelactone hydrolase family protein [Opitutaceae bacterium]|nr:dienelactone hydrolase family protein [Opitutaceae bacterium]